MSAAARAAFEIELETGGPIILPGSPFTLTEAEADLASPSVSDGRAKNVSLSPDGSVRGATADPTARARVAALMARYRDFALGVIADNAPGYAPHLEVGRTSLRTREVARGAAGKRKDDRRLHVDAFASQPTGGRRILRVFSNINPDGVPRVWKVGEPFEEHAARFASRLRQPLPGEATLLHALRITRARRTLYDALMLGLHDQAKLDDAYQAGAAGRELAFPAGASWVVFTDSVVHAALSGRFMLEQTFYLPPAALAAPEAAPARRLEAITGLKLAA